jgi:hypothetical protein
MSRKNRSPNRKLTEDQVREIRIRYERPSCTLDDLAAVYAVDRTTIWAVVTHETWRQVT